MVCLIRPAHNSRTNSRRIIKIGSKVAHDMSNIAAMLLHPGGGIPWWPNPAATPLVNSNIPLRTETISENTPTYITPLVKSLIRKRNKQLRRGKTTYAHSLSVKIGKLIAETNNLGEVKLPMHIPYQLWLVNLLLRLENSNSHKDIKKLWSLNSFFY